MEELVSPFRLEISPRGYEDLFTQMVDAVPPSKFYDHSRPLVMWSSKPNRFLLHTDLFNTSVRVTVERVGDYNQNVEGQLIRDVSLVPKSEINTFEISLGKGKNRITAVEEGGRTAVLEVIATTNTLFFEAMSREIFKPSDRINSVQNALFSKYATRMLDQVFKAQELLPSIHSTKTLSTKLLVRGTVHYPAREIGVRNLLEAFSLNTPVMLSQRRTLKDQIDKNKIQRSIQNFAGKEAHVWFPNLSVTRWIAFSKLVDSLKNSFKIVSVEDDLVEVVYKNSTQYHRFDFDKGSEFLTNLTLTNCFDNIDVYADASVRTRYLICCWTYTFDRFVDALHPIGDERSGLDLNTPFDSNLLFDADPVDPWTDGWVGWSLDGRFDGGFALDSMVTPSLSYLGDVTVYPRGPYTQLFNSARADIDISYSVGYDPANSLVTDYTAGPVTHIELEFPTSGSGSGDLTAGETYPVLLKYADANNMARLTAFGTVSITELGGGTTSQFIPDGYITSSITPVIAGANQTWSLTDGTYSGISVVKKVNPAAFSVMVIDSISDQIKDQPFTVTITAFDAYGNRVTDIGENYKVNVFTKGGFTPSSVEPYYFDFTDGTGIATAEISLSATGTGYLLFEIGALYVPGTSTLVSGVSNTFTVT